MDLHRPARLESAPWEARPGDQLRWAPIQLQATPMARFPPRQAVAFGDCAIDQRPVPPHRLVPSPMGSEWSSQPTRQHRQSSKLHRERPMGNVPPDTRFYRYTPPQRSSINSDSLRRSLRRQHSRAMHSERSRPERLRQYRIATRRPPSYINVERSDAQHLAAVATCLQSPQTRPTNRVPIPPLPEMRPLRCVRVHACARVCATYTGVVASV